MGRQGNICHPLTGDFLKNCFKELKRDKASGVDGVTVKESSAKTENISLDLYSILALRRCF